LKNTKFGNMGKLITNKNLTIINFVIVFYFILIYLINFYKIDFVLVEVLRELLTIPFLLAQIVFLIIGIIFLINNKKSFITIISLLALAVCMFITIGSFF
jgi:hypothetical protein